MYLTSVYRPLSFLPLFTPMPPFAGKCTVTLLNETESLISYLNKDDAYFYSLVYDPQQKTLLADKGEIHVGSRYQVDGIPKSAEFKVRLNSRNI